MKLLLPPGGVRGAGAGLHLLLPCWTRSSPSFAPPGGVRRAAAGLYLLLPCWTRSAPSFVPPGGVRRGARSWSWTAVTTTLLDETRGRAQSWSCCYYYPAGRDPHLPSRCQGACAELQLDCCCYYYPAGRGPCLPSSTRPAARGHVRSWSWTAAATTLLNEFRAFLHCVGSSRRQLACAELELDCGCYYPTGRAPLLLSPAPPPIQPRPFSLALPSPPISPLPPVSAPFHRPRYPRSSRRRRHPCFLRRRSRTRAAPRRRPAAAISCLPQARLQLEETLHTHIPLRALPPPSPPLGPPPRHNPSPPQSYLPLTSSIPRVSLCRFVFQGGAGAAGSGTPHPPNTEQCFILFLLTHPMSHRLRRAPAAYSHRRRRNDRSRPGEV